MPCRLEDFPVSKPAGGIHPAPRLNVPADPPTSQDREIPHNTGFE